MFSSPNQNLDTTASLMSVSLAIEFRVDPARLSVLSPDGRSELVEESHNGGSGEEDDHALNSKGPGET
jgi:hypothetical protein